MESLKSKRFSSDFRVAGRLVQPDLNRICDERETLQIEPKVMRVLVCLARSAGEVVTRHTLLETVWADTAVGEQVLSRAVSELRKSFADDSRTPRVIETIAKSGYRLIATVEAAPPAAPAVPTLVAARTAEADSVAPRRGLAAAGLLIVGLLIGASLAFVFLRGGTNPPPAPAPESRRLSIVLPTDAPPELSHFQSLALSPDGRSLVYTSRVDDHRQLFLRTLHDNETTPIAGTEGGYGPFFSPDGASIGFYAGGDLRRLSLDGGAPLTIDGDASDAQGADWGEDGTIVYTRRFLEGLYRVPAAGGKPEPLTELSVADGELSHIWPERLPDGDHVLFTVWYGASIERSRIDVVSLSTGERREVLTGGAYPRYLPTGHLLFAGERALMAAPFDLGSLALTAEPVPVLDGLLTDPFSGASHFGVSQEGTLVWATRDAYAARLELAWVDAGGGAGTAIPTTGRNAFLAPRISPDGDRLAVMMLKEGLHVWLLRPERGELERLTTRGDNLWPVWTPDGSRVAFSSDRAGAFNIFWKAVDGSGTAERLTHSANIQSPGSFSPDGRYLVYSEFHPSQRWDIWLLDLESADRQAQVYLQTQFDEFQPRFSPDGKLLAYVSNEAGRWEVTGRWEVYVRPFDNPGLRVQISTEGGVAPAWSADGRELFYREADRLMSVSIGPEPTLRAGTPTEVLGQLRAPDPMGHMPNFDVGRDGRLVAVRRVDPQPVPHLEIALDWFSELPD